MRYEYLKTNPLLADYVRSVLVLEGSAQDSEHTENELPLVTNGMPALVYRSNAEGRCDITLFGQSIPDETLQITDTAKLIIYFFKPFSLGCIFTISAAELNKNPVELINQSPQKMLALKLQLTHTSCTHQQTEILDHFIEQHLKKNERDCRIIKYATDQMMFDPGADILPRLVEELNLTERTFQRIFKKYVGITPTHYRRISQFHFAFDHLRSKQYDSLTNLAYMNGYADQSHYIRSFKEFMQTTPHHYLRFGLYKPKEE